MNMVTKPRVVSFEDALRNLAAKLTGEPVKKLPRTQEAVVQYMAENVPSVAEMAETITQEVLNRLAEMAADDAETGDPEASDDGGENTSDSEDGKEPEQPAEPEDGKQAKTSGKQAKTSGKSRKSE